MNKNLKYVFLLTTIVFLLVSVSAISAENTTGKDITDKATTVTAEKSVATQKVVNNNKNIVKTEKVNKTTKAETTTHVVTQDNVDNVFSGINYGLNNSINEGDILDFQGTIDKNHSLVINKPVNVISSTEDAIISLHTVGGSLTGDNPGNSFIINKGASGSYISGLYLNNTECWVYNLYNATLYNMTMHVDNARVGSGVGQTSVRFSNNVTLDNCYIYTKDNGGSSSFVWTGSNNCTIINSIVEGEGKVGNLFYVGNVQNPGALPEGYVLSSTGNSVINCTVRGGNGGISNPLQIGGNNTLIKGNKFYSGGTVGALAYGATRNNVTYIDNEIYNTSGLTIITNSTASGNVIYGTGKTTIETNTNVYNNTFKAVGIGTTSAGATNVNFEGNTVNGAITVEQKSSNSNITGNTINGKVTSKGANITINKNDIRTETDDYAVEATGAGNVITYNTIYAKTETGSRAVTASATSTIAKNVPTVPKTYVVTQDNVDELFSGTNYTLSNYIYDGDVLDFQGTIDKNHSIVINIPINVTSSTKDAIISLHTVAGSLLGESPGNSFVVNNGGSGSNVTGLYLNNTECWIFNVYNATFSNMTMHVQDAKVGSGVGQTAIRYSVNVTMDNCYIYTENNGGSSSFVWTLASNCTFQNSVVEGRGNVGNLIYLNTFNGKDQPASYTAGMVGNKIINCTVRGGKGGISNTLQNLGANTTIIGNKFYDGGSVSSGPNGIFEDNIIYDSVIVSLGANTIARNNTVVGIGKTTISAGSKVYDNTFKEVTISGAVPEFEGNTVEGPLAVNNPSNIVNNNLTTVSIAANGKNSNITENTINGKVTSAGANVTISENNITVDTEYAVEVTGAENVITGNTIYSSSRTGDAAVKATSTSTVTGNQPEMPEETIITDDTYPQFFDENGYAIAEKFPDYATIVLTGTFNNKIFKFKNITANINSDNAILNNGAIISEDTANIVIDGIIFNNTKEVENAVVFDSDRNIIRNSIITKKSEGLTNAREIVVNGDKNLVQNVVIDITGNSHPISYEEELPCSPITGILITGSSNTIEDNRITFHELGAQGEYASTDLITIYGGTEEEARNNIITGNELKALDAGRYLYAVNLGINANYNNVTYNDINVNSSFFAYGVQNMKCPVYGNNISYNNIRVNATNTAYGVFANIWGDEGSKFGDMQVRNNKIYVNAENAYAIQLTGDEYGGKITLENLNITYNNFYVNGTYAMGIGLAKTNNVYIYQNTYTITGLESEPNHLSTDYVQARTVGIYIKNANYTRIQTEQGNNVTNGPNVIIKDATIGTISYGVALKSDMTNIRLENSERFNITSLTINSTEDYGIALINSSSNRIVSNTLNTFSENVGNERILMDDNSQDNTISGNKPNASVVAFETTTARLNDILEITVKVTSEGKKVSNGYVTITGVNNNFIGSGYVVNGVAIIRYGIVNSMDNLTFNTQYSGYEIIPKSNEVTQEIEVESVPIIVPIEDDLTLGNETTITALFNDTEASPLPDGRAILRVNGKTLRNDNGQVIYVSVENGVANFGVNITSEWLTPDTTIQAIYIGNDNGAPVITTEQVVNVVKPTATVTLSVTSAKTDENGDEIVTSVTTVTAGDKITLTASVTNGNEEITSGRVAFKFNGKTIKDESGKAVYLDLKEGPATYEFTVPAKTKAGKEYTLTAVFTDTIYDRSQDEKEITVTR